MESSKILSASLIDVIFDGRNKEYGAYELRKTYSRRTKAALSIMIAVVALVLCGVTMANSSKKKEVNYRMGPVIELTDIKDDKPPEKLQEPEQQPEPEPMRTEKLTEIVIVDKEDIDPPPAQEDLIDAEIGITDQEGIPDDNISKPPQQVDNKKGIIEQKAGNESDEPFTTVEVDAKFNGNWKGFLERNLNANVPLDNNAPPGRYSVVIQFVVDIEGNVSDIKPLTNHGYGVEEEAVRVLKKASKWEPAIQNGIKVKAYRRQVIIFEVPEE